MTARFGRGAAGALILSLALYLFCGPVAAGAAVDAGPTAGEVLAVAPDGGSLWLRTPDGADRVVRLAPGAALRREGQLATLAALRPVAPGFRHEVRVWFGADGLAVRVEAAYPGREGRVVAVGAQAVAVAWMDGGTEVVALRADCRANRRGAWEEPGADLLGKWVYVLCDFAGRAKNIAVSE